jgi:hypothetical protein
MDELVVNYIVSNYPKESATRLEIGSTPLVTRELYFALTRTRADAESIITRFNSQLRGMISDRTYHRLLHVDWIRADINGDGVAEYVPLNDRTGPTEPQRVYTLFSAPQTTSSKEPTKPGFYVGGQHLQRLGERAGQLQGRQPAAAGRPAIDGQHLQVQLVIISAA